MLETMSEGILVTLAFGALGAVSTIAGTTWRVSKILNKQEINLLTVMTDHEQKDTERFGRIEQEISNVGDSIRREFGESLQAIRQRIGDVEIWGRDNYVQTPTFNRAMDEIKALVTGILKKLDERPHRG